MKTIEKQKCKQYDIPFTYSTYLLNKEEKRKYFIFSSMGLIFVSYLFYHSAVISIAFTTLSYPGLRLYRNYLAEKRKREFIMQFRDLLYSLSASISTGRQMSEALYEGQQNMKMIYQEDALIVLELAQMVKRLFESRESEEEILSDFARRSDLDDIIHFVDIYLTCRKTGGDLMKVIRKASEMILDKITIEQEINSLTAQKRYEVKILTGIPIVIIIFLQLVSPDYISVMYEGIQGRLLMTAGLLGIAFSYLWSMKLIAIKI